MQEEEPVELVNKWKSRSLFFALLVFITASYFLDDGKLSSSDYSEIVMWTMIMYGAKRSSDNLLAKK